MSVTLLAALALFACGDDTTTADSGTTVPTDSGTTDTTDTGTTGPTDSGTTGPTDSGTTDTDTPAPSACDEPSTGAAQTTVSLTVDGMARQYRVTIPAADAGVPLPVLMAFHGGGGRSEPFPQERLFEDLAADHGVITVYALAELQAGHEGEWILNTSDETRHDLDYVEAILDELSASHCVDQSRVYATGYSLGAMFVYELACHLSGRFAAISGFGGTMPLNPRSCELDDPLAVLHLHGQSDGIIAYGNQWDWKDWDFVGTMMDIPGLVEFWGDKLGCTDAQETTTTSSLYAVHSGCSGDVRVEHHGLIDQGHGWPRNIDGVSTQQVIWEFVSGFSKP